jgi:glycosyltransferase involved in cell wall biosynthesis
VVRVVPHAPGWTRKWRAYRAVPQRYSIENVEVETVRAFFPPRMLGMEYLPLQVDGALRRVIADFAPDLVHAHCLIPSGQLAARQSPPYVLTAHGSDAYDWAWRRAGLRQAAAEGIGHAAAVVAVSEFIRRNVHAIVPREARVIYNGADEAVFHPQDRGAARRGLDISPERFVIAFAGRPARPKGALDLVEAAARLDPRPLVLVAGPSPDDADLIGASTRNDVDVRVCGMLSHDELARALAAADVFALPSYNEGLPLAVCEAMLSGRPVVATPVGGIPEIVRDGVHGYLVPPGNVPLLAERLRAIADDPSQAALMGDRSYAFARDHLTWAANASAYNALYHEICRAAA